ncbi:DUF6371 domain-containing protein [Salegentibacter chungangensis]|uniref:DUF6371 domain-containing protein n=1 Tax=Salegentibacter chungangensis TaxID=1335724 RepID=A0ABW3NV48_9FLAO
MEKELKFEKKRKYRLVTPCCGKSNRDGKFVNYQGFPEQFGYCHSCGKASLPFSGQLTNPGYLNKIKNSRSTRIQQQFVPEKIIWNYYRNKPENNLIRYLKRTYEHGRVQETLEKYAIGTCKAGGTVFWMINKNHQVQKCKVAFYDQNGKRTNRFKVPYKNEEGYYACLFGAHLLINYNKGRYTVVLVESEKTALVGDILLPQFTWLAYGGLNGLTNDKIESLKGHKILLVPDMSNQAVLVAMKQVNRMKDQGIKIKLWDMRYGKTDEELKKEGIYNHDLEDYFRKLENITNIYSN